MARETAFLFAGSAALLAAVLSFALSFLSRALAAMAQAYDQPGGGRKIHRDPVPLWGGLGIAVTLLSSLAGVCVLASTMGQALRPNQIVGFGLGICILLVGGLIDDVHPLPPRIQVLFPSLAAIAVILGGTGIVQLTRPGSLHGFQLLPWQTNVLTFAWLLVATYATKILDGLDGLVTGLAAIGSGIVAALALSPNYFQPLVGILSAAAGGTFLGFLPRNAYPAKQFLGEAGSTIAGFTLGVLAILSSAKVAVALAVLAIPIADIGLVMLGRMRRGLSPFAGDDSHLHFRLLKAGLSHRLAVFLYWAIAFAAGILALGLQTRGKVFLVISLIALAALASFATGYLARRRSYEA